MAKNLKKRKLFIYTEFLLKSKKYDLNIRIECKWQQSAGSVDEKLPHLYLSAIDAIPEDNVIILIDGKGFREGAICWLRNAVDNRLYIPPEKQHKNILMMDATETRWFHSLLNHTDAICFPDRRIAFETDDGKHVSGNTRGQVFFYFGHKVEKFEKVFGRIGAVLYPSK